MAGTGDGVPARAFLREAAAALRNVHALARSPRVGAKLIAPLLPEVAALLAPLGGELARGLGLVAAVPAHEAARRELVAFGGAIAAEARDALERAAGRGVDARARLGLELELERLLPSFEGACGLVDALEGSIDEGPVEVDLRDLLEAAFATPGPAREPGGRDVPVLLEGPLPSAAARLRPHTARALLVGAVGWVGRGAGGEGPAPVALRVSLAGGRAFVELDAGPGGPAGAGREVWHVRAPAPVAPAPAALAWAASRGGGRLRFLRARPAAVLLFSTRAPGLRPPFSRWRAAPTATTWTPFLRVCASALARRGPRAAGRPRPLRRGALCGQSRPVNSHLIPSRLGRPKNDPIFGLARLAAERRAAGHPVIDATIGVLLDDEGKLALLATATRALREVSPVDAASYAPIAGTPAFLAAVTRDLLGDFPALAGRAAAVATPGGTGALRHAIVSLLGEGQALLTTSLYWAPYATLADENGRALRTFAMFDAERRFDSNALEAALAQSLADQGRAVVVLNDPCHNPSGYSMSEDDWRRTAKALADASARGPVSVVLDLAYTVFAEAGASRALAALAPVADRVLILLCWSASKTFLQYGQRVGALVAVATDEAEREELAAALSFASRGTWSNCNHGGLEAVTRLLADPALRASVDAERRSVLDLLARRVDEWNRLAPGLGLHYPPYAGGFFVTVSCDDPQAAAAALRDRDAFVVPVSGALRVALCSVPLRDVERLVRAIADVVVAPGRRAAAP